VTVLWSVCKKLTVRVEILEGRRKKK